MELELLRSRTNQCEQIVEESSQKCTNSAYAIVEIDGRAEILCRLHFSIKLNDPSFRNNRRLAFRPQDLSDMQALYELHNKKPEVKIK